ncbi:MAG: LPS export ABC transporter permease LptG [Desulforegulaceae bacterium]|nr:LPS export ABC transporter permease LptG [Desulforegulaceae bacterium]
MSLLTRYLIKGYFKVFFLIEIFLIFIFLIIDYLNNLDKFVKAGLSVQGGIGFVLLKIPFVIVHLTPVSIVVAAVIFFGLMNKNKEIIALCSSGINLKKIYFPILILSLVFSAFVFLVSDFLMPFSSSKLNLINSTQIKKNRIISENKTNIWIKDNNKIIYIDYFNYEKKMLRNITINEFNDKYFLSKRYQAKSAVFENNKWLLNDIYYSEGLEKDYGQEVIHLESKDFVFNFVPEELKEVIKLPEEMSLLELEKYIKSLKAKGYEYQRYLVDLNSKTAFPFVCFIMAIIGTLIGTSSITGKKIPLGVGLSLFLSLLYWSMHSFFISLGYGENINPFLAAWTANIVFGVLGLLVFIFYEKKLIQSS